MLSSRLGSIAFGADGHECVSGGSVIVFAFDATDSLMQNKCHPVYCFALLLSIKVHEWVMRNEEKMESNKDRVLVILVRMLIAQMVGALHCCWRLDSPLIPLLGLWRDTLAAM